MPTEKLTVKDQRKKLLTRLSRLSVKYRRPGSATTLAGGSRQTLPSTTTSLIQDVIHFEQAPMHENSTLQPTTFIGYTFQAAIPPRNIEVSDLAETLAGTDNYTWIDLSNYVAEDLQTLAQALRIHSIATQAALSPGAILAWMFLETISL
ncbi:hypothetical protein [Dictyobacter kobayashii]|uniref:Uncharacterized protein n=1 Tax=Dictyobacter kobayashii TaxID=2014872 RepID=A0A402AS45_9CHLR|nr:hypothetical protein [Dictyobacter kobayashii]GCE21925.1 hypothetical protein KDK_57250 [Dictyobacter kobayashii]